MSSLEAHSFGMLSTEATTRRLAQIELIRRSGSNADDARKLFTELATNEKEQLPSRLLAVGGLQQLWNDATEKTLLSLLTDKDPDVRRVACDAARRPCALSSWPPAYGRAVAGSARSGKR